MGHVTVENRHELAEAGKVTPGNGTAERRGSKLCWSPKPRREAHHSGRGHRRSCRGFSRRQRHAARDPEQWADQNRQAATQRHRPPHHTARRLRHVAIPPRDDQCAFGWGKQHGTMRKIKHRGIARAVDFLLNLIAYNLIRIPKIVAV
jgi:hypothetical protein